MEQSGPNFWEDSVARKSYIDKQKKQSDQEKKKAPKTKQQGRDRTNCRMNMKTSPRERSRVAHAEHVQGKTKHFKNRTGSRSKRCRLYRNSKTSTDPRRFSTMPHRHTLIPRLSAPQTSQVVLSAPRLLPPAASRNFYGVRNKLYVYVSHGYEGRRWRDGE